MRFHLICLNGECKTHPNVALVQLYLIILSCWITFLEEEPLHTTLSQQQELDILFIFSAKQFPSRVWLMALIPHAVSQYDRLIFSHYVYGLVGIDIWRRIWQLITVMAEKVNQENCFCWQNFSARLAHRKALFGGLLNKSTYRAKLIPQ